MSRTRLVMLGAGGSMGVPMVGNRWGACDPAEPRNRRTRPSVAVSRGASTLLVDTTPDLRDQLNATGIEEVDAVLYTHAHADHVHGIDDLRGLWLGMRRPIDIHGDADTLRQISERFRYLFEGSASGLYPPFLRRRPFAIGDTLSIGAFPDIVTMAQDHGTCVSVGFRFGPIAYSTDVVVLDEAAFARLSGVQIWVVDCCRREPHVAHAHLERVLEWVARLRPARTVLTHMNQTMDYRTLLGELPPGVEPGYDGLVLEA